MCTAVFDNRCGHYFGRTLDLEYSLGEEVVICPGRYELSFLNVRAGECHLAIMGTAAVRDGFPLYYDAVNEAGVAAAALNFPISAKYSDYRAGRLNLASFELIPYLLGSCTDLGEVKKQLSRVNVTSTAFSEALAASPLHWIFADRSGSLVFECSESGAFVYDNPIGVLTNEPRFEYQLIRLSDYMGLDAKAPKNNLSGEYDPIRYSRGLGGFGLPGDFSSASRFVRATFVKNHISADGAEGVERFFHIMDSVFVPRGCVVTDEGREVETVYTSAIDLDTLTYHYTTYSSRNVRSVRFAEGRMLGSALLRYPMKDLAG